MNTTSVALMSGGCLAPLSHNMIIPGSQYSNFHHQYFCTININQCERVQIKIAVVVEYY